VSARVRGKGWRVDFFLRVFCFFVQQNNVPDNIIDDLTVHLFLGIYNCEINRAHAVSLLLQSAQVQNFSEMVFHIMGHIGSNLSSENIMFDLCLVLQTITIPQYSTLCARVENYTMNQTVVGPLMTSKVWPHQCRLSLRKVLQTMQHENNTMTVIDNCVPPDMPLHAISWASKSCTEQQITLLIVCMQSSYMMNKFAFIQSLFGGVVTSEIDKYKVQHLRIESIIAFTLPLLHKINGNIDMSNTTLITLVNRFVEECFNGIFGQVHRALMTLSFFTQMYIIAYVESPMRVKFYQHIVENFNRRLETANKGLTISCNIPHNLITNMDFWAQHNPFSAADFLQTFKTMCI